MQLLPRLLAKVIQTGSLTLIGPDGAAQTFGGANSGPEVTLRINDPALDRKLLLNPELRLAEAYMDGALEIERSQLRDLLRLFKLNKGGLNRSAGQAPIRRLAKLAKRISRNNPIRSRRNVAAHYDIGNDLYRLFLDADMQYSCAYFPEGTETLEQAQLAKKRHIAAKLRLAPGQRVLDIGCGWGGMALYLAQVADVEVLGVTLAEEQLALARERAEAVGLGGRVRFALQDYRSVSESFDRVVSVGMFEHVGLTQMPTYFRTVRDRLTDDGVALVHSIMRMGPPGATDPFTAKYIFPGGYIPALSETTAAVEQSRLWLQDCEIWRKHYGFTLAEWAKRFEASRDKAKAMYDERFCRMWELYLAGAESSFMTGRMAVMQLQLGRERDAVPISRDYLAAETERLKAREAELGIDKV
ncbi:MAG: cyclopropane-fatty-acyl-phospholipid synthase family protein [Paracoccaceae bacterium]|nr:cyclopropane-fatty-acyl-phospholipid synthase family protein [Paracoccaceae bacterium]